MRQLADFHHYNAGVSDAQLTRVERLERQVISSLLGPSSLADDRRESSIAFELKHSSGVLQFARALARKRSLELDSAAAGALLHDIYVIEEGMYENHAALGAPIARRYMEEAGGFTEGEISAAERLVASHSDKHVWSGDPYSEFGKDIDVLDCFLYPGAFDYYLLHKPFAVFFHYLKRAQRMWGELNLPPEPTHTILDEYEAGAWMPYAFSGARTGTPPATTPSHSAESSPPYAIFGDLDAPTLRTTHLGWAERGRIAAHARTVAAQVRAAEEHPPILVFPVLGRWTPLRDRQEIDDLGDMEEAGREAEPTR